MFERKEGYFRETANDQVMEKVDAEGNVIGFSVLKARALKERQIALRGGLYYKRQEGARDGTGKLSLLPQRPNRPAWP